MTETQKLDAFQRLQPSSFKQETARRTSNFAHFLPTEQTRSPQARFNPWGKRMQLLAVLPNSSHSIADILPSFYNINKKNRCSTSECRLFLLGCVDNVHAVCKHAWLHVMLSLNICTRSVGKSYCYYGANFIVGLASRWGCSGCCATNYISGCLENKVNKRSCFIPNQTIWSI